MIVRREILAEDRALAERRRAEALARARKVAAWLKEKYDVDGVYLFGSLAWGGFNSHSDIDLLVKGFKDKNRYWQMQVEAENIAEPFDLNLLCEEEVPESLRRKVAEKGVKLA
ncbi:Polymerase beta, Nucleotidyltransferase [Neomoorella glycerini]|uniref:Polymerase beta, Nucleotidyltransferase n=2 Tax=Neomoorella glycerini TaxID=55779 RepID=A0A6I5ZSU0_9FIRM|nr:Polymerase beta, Nucleotidyltransferase [Moorella glycerini]